MSASVTAFEKSGSLCSTSTSKSNSMETLLDTFGILILELNRLTSIYNFCCYYNI